MKKFTLLAVCVTAFFFFGFHQVVRGQAPTTQASNITFSSVTGTGMTVSWTNGDGIQRIVLIKTSNTFTDPVDGTDPVANATYGGVGQQVIYNGNGNSVAVVFTNPVPIYYWFKVYEYNGTGAATQYCLLAGTNNPTNQARGTLCGTKTVGVGGDYATLTAAALDINSRVLCGALNLILTDITYPAETFPIVIRYNLGSSSTSTITIKPAPGVSPVITGDTYGEVFLLYGSDYVIIDGSNQVGGTSKDLSIINTYIGGVYNCAFNLLHNGTRGATNSTIKNCIIKSTPTILNSFGIAITEGGGGFQNTSIINNTIKNARFGIQFVGAVGNINNDGIIADNIIGDTAEPLTQGGILMSYSDNTIITGNEIFGNVADNLVENQYGISIKSGSTNTKIRKNKIHDFHSNSTYSHACWGVLYNAEATTITEISNNLMFNIRGDGNMVSADHPEYVDRIPAGISIMAGGNFQIYNNTIDMTGNTLGITFNSNFQGSSACLVVNAAVTLLDVRNNIFKNSMTRASGTGANKTFGVVSYSENSAFADINFNDYYIDGINPNIGFLSVDSPTLADWQTATAKDANSVSANPGFVSITDLHPGQSGPNNKGITIAGITTDFADVTRSSPPDIGAYEYSMLAAVVTEASSGLTSSGATLNGSVNANNESAAVTFEYGPTLAYGTSKAGTPSPVTGSVATAVSSSLTGLLPNTTYHFRVNANTAAGIAHGSDLTFTTDAVPATVVTDAATNLSISSAQLNGTVTANYASTTVTFEWGLTAAYGNTISAVPSSVDGGVATAVLADLAGLTSSTIYHYRCVGVNVAGTTYGDDQSFSTLCTNPEAAGPITGVDLLCAGTTGVIYATDPIAGATGYSWSIPEGGSIISGANTTSITVDFDPLAVSGDISVYGTSDCGNGVVSVAFAVTVDAMPPTPVISQVGNTLFSDAPTGNQWYMNGDLIDGATASTYDVTMDDTYTTIVTINGCSSNRSNSLNVIFDRIVNATAGKFEIFPVPSIGLFTTTIAWPKAEIFTIRVYNSIGNLMLEKKDISVNGSTKHVIDLSTAPAGMYTVTFTSGTNQVNRKIIISSK